MKDTDERRDPIPEDFGSEEEAAAGSALAEEAEACVCAIQEDTDEDGNELGPRREDHAAVEHHGRHELPAELAPRLVELVEHDSLDAVQAVAHVRQVVERIGQNVAPIATGLAWLILGVVRRTVRSARCPKT